MHITASALHNDEGFARLSVRCRVCRRSECFMFPSAVKPPSRTGNGRGSFTGFYCSERANLTAYYFLLPGVL